MSRIQALSLIGILLVASVFLTGCVQQRAILIPPGEPVQLAEPVKAHIFVEVDGKIVRSDNRVTIPAGWFALPDPGDE